MAITYFIEKDEKILFNGVYMEAYIPDYLFTKNIAQFDGDRINTIGLFNYRVSSKIDQDISSLKVETFKFPSMMTMKPNVVETKEMELVKGSGTQRYYILKFFNGDVVMKSSFAVASVDNVEMFIELLNAGKIPNTIPYRDILHLFRKNLEINKINLNVPATLLSTIISEIYRYKKDMSVPLRKVIGKGKADELEYIAANNRTVCSYNSTFSALTFEDIDSMITTSINKKRYNRPENYTPIEKIIEV